AHGHLLRRDRPLPRSHRQGHHGHPLPLPLLARFGIGGDYLLSATIMSEYAYKKTRDAFIAVVFTTQGFGILTGGIVSIIISAAFKERFDYPAYRDDRTGSTVPEADYIWCTTLMLGALPAALTYYWRMKMPETARYTALVAKNAKRAAPEYRGII
ncbi:unnamed protein product, partial [Musa acuminata subsp. burmannicoides]